MPQMGFFDLSDRYASLDAKKDRLVEINAVVPWDEFRPLLERIWRKPDEERKSRAGRKPLDAVVRPAHSDQWRSGPHCSRRWF
jgi:IS5 family transposase